MTTVTNNHKGDLGLPNGLLLKHGVPTDVPEWREMAGNAVVHAWVKAKILTVQPQQAEKDVRDEKDALLDELLAYGINKDRRSSVETLQELLDKAKSAAEGAI